MFSNGRCYGVNKSFVQHFALIPITTYIAPGKKLKRLKEFIICQFHEYAIFVVFSLQQ